MVERGIKNTVGEGNVTKTTLHSKDEKAVSGGGKGWEHHFWTMVSDCSCTCTCVLRNCTQQHAYLKGEPEVFA